MIKKMKKKTPPPPNWKKRRIIVDNGHLPPLLFIGIWVNNHLCSSRYRIKYIYNFGIEFEHSKWVSTFKFNISWMKYSHRMPYLEGKDTNVVQFTSSSPHIFKMAKNMSSTLVFYLQNFEKK
jgi:hypothetical protein